MSQKVTLGQEQSLRERVAGLGQPYARDGGRLDRAAALLRRPLDRRRLRAGGRLPEMGRLAGAGVAAPTRGRVLLLALRAWPNHAAYEGVLAAALRARGADVAVLTCGGGQPACEMGWGRRMLPRPCDRCAFYTDELVHSLRLPHHRLADRLPWGPDARAAPSSASTLDPGIDVAAASRISVPWFVRTADPASVPEGPAATRDFEVAAAGVERAIAELCDEFQPEVMFMVNGLFAAEDAARRVARERGIRTPTYEIAPRAGALVFSQDAPAPSYDTDAAWREHGVRPLTAEQQGAIEQLLTGRQRGEGAHERFFESPLEDRTELRRALGVSDDERIVSLFTNLSWDSAALFHDVAYGSMMDWIEDAIHAVGERDGTTLVVRVHPSEAKWGTREEVEAEMRARLGDRIEGVRFVAPEEPLSSYALMDQSDLVLVYTSTVGLEAATRGIPVAVAGDTHYRGRGFTYDLADGAELRAALARAGGRLDPEMVELAWRYAFTFFFRCMVPFPSVAVDGHQVAGLPGPERIAPGADPYLDWVCDRILDGRSFVLPDELAVP
jgi:hypothetical protein